MSPFFFPINPDAFLISLAVQSDWRSLADTVIIEKFNLLM
jgi:hypothetical protein